MEVSILLVGLLLGSCKALLHLDPEGSRPGGSVLPIPLASLSLPFLGLSFLLWAGWPGGLTGAGALGGFLIVAGAALLGYAFLVADRSAILHLSLAARLDRWITPPELYPLGARWGWREELLAALLLAPPAAALARSGQDPAALLRLLGAWLGLVRPLVLMRIIVNILHKARRGGEGGNSPFLYSPGLNRSILGLVSLALALLGARFVYLGLERIYLALG